MTNLVQIRDVCTSEACKLVGAFLIRPYLPEVSQVVPSRQPARPISSSSRVGHLPKLGPHGAKAACSLYAGDVGRLVPFGMVRLYCKLQHRRIEVVDRKRDRSQPSANIQCVHAISAHWQPTLFDKVLQGTPSASVPLKEMQPGIGANNTPILVHGLRAFVAQCSWNAIPKLAGCDFSVDFGEK